MELILTLTLIAGAIAWVLGPKPIEAIDRIANRETNR